MAETLTTATSPLTTIVPFNSLPPCASSCGPLFDANGGCVPPSVPEDDEDAYVSCFCSNRDLQSFYTDVTGVCDEQCTRSQDLFSIRAWYTGLCTTENSETFASTAISTPPGITGTSSTFESTETTPSRPFTTTSSSSDTSIPSSNPSTDQSRPRPDNEPNGSESPESSQRNGLETGAIAGIAVGAVAGLAVFAVLVWLVFHYRKKAMASRAAPEENPHSKPELDATQNAQGKQSRQASVNRHELAADVQRHELDINSRRPELP